MSVTIRGRAPALCLLLLPALSGAAHAARPADVAGGPASGWDRETVEDTVDTLMADRLRADRIPGGVFVVVKDGEVVLAKGYGLADIDQGRPVSADTLFPVASVSKVFTATAVMQLVEQGRLDLDADVNRYLRGFRVPDAFGQPVRVWHLLTHTAGFDSRGGDMSAPSAAEIQPLGAYLATNMPPRLVPPGTMALYSNYGIALAGHLVEIASGLRFSEYVQRHILQPLSMSRSTLTWRDSLEAESATGYRMRSQELRPAPHVRYLNVAPAASLVTTGSDMARFMVAQLEETAPGGGRLFSRATARLMHARRFAQHPRAGAMACGFFERVQNGRRTLMHDGDWSGYSARLLLVPEERLGLFVAFNRWHAGARAEVMTRFLDRYFSADPARAPQTQAASTVGPSEVVRLEGTYRWNRYPHRSTLTLASLPPEYLLTAVSDDSLRFASGGLSFKRIEPLVYRREDGKGHLAFLTTASGAISHVVIETPDASGFTVMERVPWYGRLGFHKALRWALLVVLASTLVWPLALLARRLARLGNISADTGWRRAWLWAGLQGILILAFQWRLPRALGAELMRQSTASARLVLWIPVLTAMLLPPLLYYSYRSWVLRPPGIRPSLARLHYVSVTAAVVVHLVWAGYWNLLVPPR